MPDQSPLSPDDPIMVAWNRYTATDEYANTKRWAVVLQHTDGSLWAAFLAGYESGKALAEEHRGEVRQEP